MNQEGFAAFEAAMNGPEGSIAASNNSFAKNSAEGALVSLGLRENNNASTKAMKGFRGTLMDNYSGDVAQYMHNLENGGMDFSEVMSGAETYMGGMGSYKSSGKIGQISSDILSMLLGSNGAIYQNITGQQDSYKKGADALKTASNVTRLLQKLSVFAELDDEAKAALPDSVRPLVAQYQTLVNQIRQQLGE